MVTAKIHNVFKSLTATEQRIATYILNNPDKVIHMTSKELSDICDTVPSAVNRMCKSIGIDGFSKLKINLAGNMGGEECDEINTSFNKDDDAETIFKKVFNSGMNALKNTCDMFDFSEIEKIANAISKAERVYVFGVGTSAIVAQDTAYRFSQLGVQAYAYTDILQMHFMAKNMKKTDVAFCISHSGNTKIVVDAMRFAKQAGAFTVALTSFTKSFLYKESDFAVSVYADEENYPVEAVSARIAHMCTVDALMLTIASLNFDDYSQHILLRNEALEEIRYK